MYRQFLCIAVLVIFFACTNSEIMDEELTFPIFPAAAVLQPKEQIEFVPIYEKYTVQPDPGIGTLINNRTYLAPSEIQENQVEELLFEANGMTATMPIFLLGPSGQKVAYNGDWQEIGLTDRVLEANVWGANENNTEKLALSIMAFDVKQSQYAGWEWDIKSEDRSTIKCYPEIVYGWKPWRNQSTTQELPIALHQLKKIKIQYEAIGAAYGSHNLAFDLWVSQAPSISVEHINAEIMIWESWEALTPVGELQENVDTPYGKYEFWTGTTHDGWPCYSFRRTQTRKKAELDAAWFIKFLEKNDYLNKSHFLASIEFGNEVATGNGITILKDYTVEIR